MKDLKRFYTYAYLREDRTPYYIGKGEGDRAFYRRKRTIKPPKDKSRIILLKQNLSEEEAFKHEKYMISIFGRKDLGTGILRNRTDGGEGVSGLIHSEEHRRKNSEANRGEKNCNYGNTGEKSANFGKTWWTNGKNDTISFECPGEGWVLGRNTIRKGEQHPNYNKKGKNSNAYGRKWWNDGCGNMKHSFECPGEGWVLGMSEERRLKTNGVNKGKKWWNDGKGNSVMSIECPDEGWVLGRGKVKD